MVRYISIGNHRAIFFFENETGNAVTVNADRYVEMLQNFFTPQLARFPVNLNTLFQQDGATSHTARMSMKAVKALFPNRVVSRNGDITCPPSPLPRLNPLRLFSLGVPEDKSLWNKAKNYRGFKTANSRWSGWNSCGDAARDHEQFHVPNWGVLASKRKPSWGRYFQNINFSNRHKTKWLFICFPFITNK